MNAKHNKSEFPTYKGYEWIVHDPDLLGGKPTIKGTRISVALVLECLAAEMTADEIAAEYESFPKESIPEVLTFSSKQMNRPVNPDELAA